MVNVSDRARMHWHGKWIWAQYFTSRKGPAGVGNYHANVLLPEEKNVYLFFRKTFSPKEELKTAIINITADSRYKLFVNGQYVGRGINRCEAYYWYYNSYDITKYLHPGKPNVIAVHGRYYGYDFAYYTQPETTGFNKKNAGKGGLLFDVQLTYGSPDHDVVEWLGSDLETKVIRNPGEVSQLPLKNDSLGFMEECDNSKIWPMWNHAEFDDGAWETPMILDYPIKTLLIDENAPLHEEFVAPAEILEIGQTFDIMKDMDEEDEADMDYVAQCLLEGKPEPNTAFTIENQEALVSQEGVCIIRPTPDAIDQTFSLFLRFPREMVGYPQIVVEGGEGTIIDLIPSEKMAGNMPALDLMGQKRGSRVILREGKQFFEQWDWEGYLYMLVKIRNITQPLKIYRLGSNITHMRVPKKGVFKCSDPNLDRLWEACAHTVLCCAIDGYLDCPSREQRAYLGDAYPEALVANATFGEPRLTKKLIYDTAFGQRKDGMTYSFHPGDAEKQTHIIPDYCLYWIQIAEDYYRYYGDEKVLTDLYPHFVRAMDWFWNYIDKETGLLKDLPYWLFIDWSFGHSKPGYWAILNTQFMDVLRFMVELAEKFNQPHIVALYSAQIKKMKTRIEEMFWDPALGCYRDYLHEGKLHGQSYMTNAYLILKDIAPRDKWDGIISTIFDNEGTEENLKKQIDDYYMKPLSHHAFGDKLKDMIVVAQPFFMHQVNKMFAKLGRYDLLFTYLQKWVPMLDLGKTGTIWETWSIAGSECHAWAATPAYDLTTYWLGIRPTAPGFTEFLIAPTFYGLDWVKGKYPSFLGDIVVEWRKSESAEFDIVTVQVNLSEQTLDGTFRALPYGGRECSQVETQCYSKGGEFKDYTLSPGENILVLKYANAK